MGQRRKALWRQGPGAEQPEKQATSSVNEGGTRQKTRMLLHLQTLKGTGADETDPWIKHSSHTCEDQYSDPQHPQKARQAWWVEVETGNPQGKLV